MCGLSLAWVTSENSTMLLESDILRLFFTGPYLVSSPLCSVSGVDCPSILPRQLLFCCLPLCSPATNCLSWSPATNYQLPLSRSRRQLSFASPYHSRVRRDFMSKNPLSGFAPKQTIESSALAAYPHNATLNDKTQYAIIIVTLIITILLKVTKRHKLSQLMYRLCNVNQKKKKKKRKD